MSLSNKVAIITGASSGIGAATAILFSKLGASLVISGRNEIALNSTLQQCDELSKSRIVKVVGDLTDDDVIKNIVDVAVKLFGKINILVNSAGIIKFGNIENMQFCDYDEVMNSNVKSVIKLTQLCVPYLIAEKGSVVNVSSVCGTRSFPNVLAYGISKAAIDQFTKCVALELAAKGVRVNAVNPGVVVTDLQKRGGLNDEQYTKFLEHSKTTHPLSISLNRLCSAEEVAKTILFLASDDASFTTGELFHVDGGRHAVCPR